MNTFLDLPPGASFTIGCVTSTTESVQLKGVSTYQKRAGAGRRGHQGNWANDNVSPTTEKDAGAS